MATLSRPRRARRACIAIVAAALAGCAFSGGTLVPPLVTEDPALPSITITVAGHARRVHVRTFGDPAAPVLLGLHGSLGDARSLLALSALSDRFYVVLWDQRGNGLSERITREEYTEDAIVQEIDAIADHYAPSRRVTLVGHSFGGMYTALYLSRRPERVERAALLEPGGINGAIFAATYDQIVRLDLLDPGLNAMFWQNAVLSPVDHERIDARALMVLLNGRQTRYFCDPAHPPPLPVWRPGGHVDLLRQRLIAPRGAFEFDFGAGLDRFERPVLLVGASCSGLGPEFQRRYHLPLFRSATLATIEGAGHRFPSEKPEETVALLRAFLR